MSLLRRSLELGLGAVMLTKEAAEEVLDDLAGQRSEADSDDHQRRLQALADRGRELWGEVEASIRREVAAAVEHAGLVRRSEYEQLLQRVTALEQRTSGPDEVVSASDL